MIIPEIRKHISPTGEVWLAVITLVTGVPAIHSPIPGQTSYTVWQAINPQGEMETWGCVSRLHYGYSSARKAIVRRWKKQAAQAQKEAEELAQLQREFLGKHVGFVGGTLNDLPI